MHHHFVDFYLRVIHSFLARSDQGVRHVGSLEQGGPLFVWLGLYGICHHAMELLASFLGRHNSAVTKSRIGHCVLKTHNRRGQLHKAIVDAAQLDPCAVSAFVSAVERPAADCRSLHWSRRWLRRLLTATEFWRKQQGTSHHGGVYFPAETGLLPGIQRGDDALSGQYPGSDARQRVDHVYRPRAEGGLASKNASAGHGQIVIGRLVFERPFSAIASD